MPTVDTHKLVCHLKCVSTEFVLSIPTSKHLFFVKVHMDFETTLQFKR